MAGESNLLCVCVRDRLFSLFSHFLHLSSFLFLPCLFHLLLPFLSHRHFYIFIFHLANLFSLFFLFFLLFTYLNCLITCLVVLFPVATPATQVNSQSSQPIIFNPFLSHSVDVIHACSYADALILQLIYYACVHVEYACAYPCKGIDSSLCSHIAICNSTVILSSFSFLYLFFIPFDHIFYFLFFL